MLMYIPTLPMLILIFRLHSENVSGQISPIHTVLCGHTNIYFNFALQPCPYCPVNRSYMWVVNGLN